MCIKHQDLIERKYGISVGESDEKHRGCREEKLE